MKWELGNHVSWKRYYELLSVSSERMCKGGCQFESKHRIRKKGESIRENNRGTSLTRFSNRGYGQEACIQFAQKWKNILDRMTVQYCV